MAGNNKGSSTELAKNSSVTDHITWIDGMLIVNYSLFIL